MKKVEMATAIRAGTYGWFSGFANPCYCLNVRMDVTKLLKRCKQNGIKPFVAMTYIVCQCMGDVESFRYRILHNEVVDVEMANVCYTVALDDGNFANSRTIMPTTFHEFAVAIEKDIQDTKNLYKNPPKTNYNDTTIVNDFYISCLPWLDFISCTQPIPDSLPESNSIPRVCWGKFAIEGKNTKVTMNITANHALVDGRDMATVFQKIQENFDCFDESCAEEKAL